jgi:hypothetical protein
LEVNPTPNPVCGTCIAALQGTLASKVNPNENRLQEILKDPRSQESFTKEVLQVSGDALAQSFALRTLALRYPPDVEAKLAPTPKAQLEEMINDHSAVLMERTSRLRGLLRPLLEAASNSGASSAVSPPVAPNSNGHDERAEWMAGETQTDLNPASTPRWQDLSFEVFAAVQEADLLLLRSLLPSTNHPRATDQVVPELRRVLSREEKFLNTYQEAMRARKAHNK